MSSFEYKILFEVRFLHDYYLYGPEPSAAGNPQPGLKSFFAMHTQNQLLRLDELLRSGQYDIRKDLAFLVGREEEKLFRKLRMKLVRTATGFFLGMEVKRSIASGGEVRFKPVIQPSENTFVTIGFSMINPLFGAISNLRLDRDTSNIYYFTNEGSHHGLSLSLPVKPIIPGQSYRMGDLALIGGSLCQAIADNKGNPRFWAMAAGQGVIHQGDRRLNVKEDWYQQWRKTLKIRSMHPAGVIRIALKSENKKNSPIDVNNYLTTRNLSTIERVAHPVYELCCLSRSTYWRYRKRDGFSENEREKIMNGADSDLVSEKDYFVTKYPRPVVRERSPGISNLPYAQPGLIKSANGKIYSDIEFNDLNPVS